MIIFKRKKKILEILEMQELNLQLAVFFKDIQKRPDEIWYKMKDGIKELFFAPPTIIPLPEDAPPEIPIVQTKSSDGAYNINISRTRADFIINFVQTLEDCREQELMNEFADSIYSVCGVSRVGISKNVMFTEVTSENSGVQRISNKYFNGGQRDAVELSFRKNVIIAIDDIDCNDIYDISAMSLIDISGEKGPSIIRVLRDINSVEKGKKLELQSAKNIIDYGLQQYSENKLRELI